MVNRVIIAVLGLGSLAIALNPPELIFTLIMFSIAIVMPLFPILVFGLYWKKATKQAAIVSAIVGTVLVLLTYFVWNIGGTWYGAIGLLGATITMVVVPKQMPSLQEQVSAQYHLFQIVLLQLRLLPAANWPPVKTKVPGKLLHMIFVLCFITI